MRSENDPIIASHAWEPIRHGSVPSLIVERILHAIEAQKLGPGDRLPSERVLAAELGVGRPSLREALGILKTQGKLEVHHGRGVFVADPEVARSLRAATAVQRVDIEELFAMREVLELPAAEWAAMRHDPGAVDKVAQALDMLTRASLEAEVDWSRLQELDATFHLRIVEASGNRFLTQTESVLYEVLSRGMETTLRIPGRLERSRADHQAILSAIVAQEPAEARRLVQAHIRAARDAALDRIRATS